jgi:hypothetical protein
LIKSPSNVVKHYLSKQTMNLRMESILVNSFLHGTAIGIKLKGKSVLIATAVTNLNTFTNHDHWIEIKPYTLYGYPIAETTIHIGEIESVIQFTVHYDDPVYVRLRELRARILELG